MAKRKNGGFIPLDTSQVPNFKFGAKALKSFDVRAKEKFGPRGLPFNTRGFDFISAGKGGGFNHPLPSNVEGPPAPLEIAPGITAPGGQKIITPEGKGIGKDKTNQLLNQVADPKSGVGKVTLPDGTSVEGNTLADLQSQLDTVNKSIGANPATLRQEVGNILDQGPLETQASVNAGKAGDFLGSNQFGVIAGRLAQAISPNSPGAQMAGQLGIDLNKAPILERYNQAIKTGEGLDSSEFNVLSQDEKTKVVNSVIQERQATLEQRVGEAKIGETQASTELKNKQAAGTLSVAQQQAQIKENNRIRVQIAKIGEADFLNIGQGFIYDIKADAFKRAPGFSAGGSGGVNQINTADFKDFRTTTAALYLEKAKAFRRQAFLDAGNSEAAANVQEMADYFTNPQTGVMNISNIIANLDEKEKANFASDYVQYVKNRGIGIDRSQTFQQQVEAGQGGLTPVMEATRQALLAAGSPDDGSGIYTVVKDGVTSKFSILPNGNLKEIK